VEGYDPQPGTPVGVDLDGIGRIEGKLVNASRYGLQILFRSGDTPVTVQLRQQLEAVREEHRELIDRARDGAAAIADALEAAIAEGRLSEDDLFDMQYEAIPDTEPVQYRTRYLDVFEDILPAIQEPLLQSDPRMVFCAAVDKNGYLPVHNAAWSKPQRPGEHDWNHANSRNRRIFDDRGGLSAARNTRPFLVQSYARDMGGEVVMMKEIDAPIAVGGRHWGGFRMAYRF
jgi:methyl-accepting chemotaxis protein